MATTEILPTKQESSPYTTVLAGNPNVGKSVVFGALTNTYTPVSNFPGTTVETLETAYEGGMLVDSPGVYGLSDLSTEEQVTRDIVLKADQVVNIVDTTHLARDLFFTAQLVDMGVPLIVFLNMMDEAREQGVKVDEDLLSDLLGVPVYAGAAELKEGIPELKAAIAAHEAQEGHAMRPMKDALTKISAHAETAHDVHGQRAHWVLALEGDTQMVDQTGLGELIDSAEKPVSQEDIYKKRRDRVNDIAGHVVTSTVKGAGWKAKLSSAMMHPLTGIPMMAVLLFIIWVVIGQWVGGDLVGLLEDGIMHKYWVPFAQKIFTSIGLTKGSVPFEYLAGEFGIFTMVPSYVLGVIFPLVSAFYLLLSLLEDSGYLPRIAVLMDRLLSFFGLNGRAVIPLILGLGCVTMGTLTTRVLTSKRERMIATALMAIAVPCSAQIAVIAAMMGRTPVAYSVIYVLFILLIFALVGTVLNKMMPGESSDLLIDLPPLRAPRPSNVIRKTSHKVYDFMKEIVLFFVAGSVIIVTLQVTGALDWIINAAAPIVVGWLKLPAQAATAFVMGFIRRDFAAAGFFSMNLTNAQLLVAMGTVTLFVPCIASAMVILKERGIRYFVVLFLTATTLAFFTGGLLMRFLQVVHLA